MPGLLSEDRGPRYLPSCDIQPSLQEEAKPKSMNLLVTGNHDRRAVEKRKREEDSEQLRKGQPWPGRDGLTDKLMSEQRVEVNRTDCSGGASQEARPPPQGLLTPRWCSTRSLGNIKQQRLMQTQL